MAHHHISHRSSLRRLAPLAALLVAPLLLIPSTPRMARAEDDVDVAELGRKVRHLASSAIPRTVLIKSMIANMGDRAGFGSGAIISADGYVLTCSHVIDIASRVEVVLSDGTTLPAQILGRNKRQDYALLKVEPAEALPYFGLGDSATVTDGQWVVALGIRAAPIPTSSPRCHWVESRDFIASSRWRCSTATTTTRFRRTVPSSQATVVGRWWISMASLSA